MNYEKNYLDISVHNFIFVQILQSYQQLFCVHSDNLNGQMKVEVRKLDTIINFHNFSPKHLLNKVINRSIQNCSVDAVTRI